MHAAYICISIVCVAPERESESKREDALGPKLLPNKQTLEKRQVQRAEFYELLVLLVRTRRRAFIKLANIDSCGTARRQSLAQLLQREKS